MLGSIAQLVQSVCLTSRGSGVRLPLLPLRKHFGISGVLFSHERILQGSRIKTHAGNQRHRQQEPDVVPDFQIQRRYPPCRSKSQPDPQRQKENNPTATQDNAGVRRTLIRFVNDVKLVRDAGNKSSPPSAG